MVLELYKMIAMKNKPVSIRYKILSFLLIVSILSSIIIYILFKLAVSPDIEMYISTNLLDLTNTIESKYNQDIVDKDMDPEEKFKDLIDILSNEINDSKLMSGIHIALFNSSAKVLYPDDNITSDLTNDLLNQAFTSIDFKNQNNKNKILKLYSNNNNYYASIIRTDIYKEDYLLIYLSKDIIDSFLKPLDYTMIIILVLTTIISIVLSHFMAISLSKPIKDLSNITKDIANGHYKPLKNDNNIQEIIELNENINHLVYRLEKYYSSQKMAFQNASHELRTPLMSIQGYAEGIKYAVFDDLDAPTDIIIAESKRLNAIVERLLELSKLDTYDFELNLEYLNLYDVLKDYSNRLVGITYKDDLEILIDCSKNILIHTDEYLLSKVILNLLSNCLRYANKVVIISVELDDSYINIKINDDGKGFDEDDLKNMFSRFYKGKGGKFGLGLPIAKSAITYLNGDISANNTDIGAEFTIKLPL